MSDSEAKTVRPSQRKLRRARERGQVAQRRDLQRVVTTLVGLAVVVLLAGSAWSIGSDLAGAALDQVAQGVYGPGPLMETAADALLMGLRVLIGAIALAAVVTALILNRGFVLALPGLVPNISHLDPIKGMSRVFGKRSLIELLKSLLRLAFSLILLAGLALWTLPDLAHLNWCGPGCAFDAALSIAAAVLLCVLSVAAVAAVIDLPVQNALFESEQMMTRSEETRERKDMHGAPEIRREQRRLRNEAARQKHRTGARHATLVIFGNGAAAAIRYVPAEHAAPILVARGTRNGEAALLDAATRGGVSLYRDGSLAADLARGRPGTPVPQPFYTRTAAALAAAGAIRR